MSVFERVSQPPPNVFLPINSRVLSTVKSLGTSTSETLEEIPPIPTTLSVGLVLCPTALAILYFSFAEAVASAIRWASTSPNFRAQAVVKKSSIISPNILALDAFLIPLDLLIALSTIPAGSLIKLARF